MEFPADLKYTKSHEWVRVEGDVATVGVSDHAQSEMGDIVYVELPEVGATFEVGDEAAVVESVKAASEIYAPVAGEVTEVNDDLNSDPGLVNRDARGDGWFLKINIGDPSPLAGLMTEADYKDMIEGLG